MKIKKDALLAELEAQRDVAKAIDAARLAKHKVAVRECAAHRRGVLRALIKLDERTLAETRTYDLTNKGGSFGDSVGCPLSVVARLDQAIKEVRLDFRQTITLSSRHDNWLSLLNLSVSESDSTVCK